MLRVLENPLRFMRFSGPAIPILLTMGAALLALGWSRGLAAPVDFRQGAAVRIMFVHVPAAWCAMAAYAMMTVASVAFLLFRGPIADIAARSAALPGAVFTAVCLATGSLWGRPIWNTWWEWDARMTSVLVLLFLFAGHIALCRLHEDRRRAARMAAIYCLVGAVNLPIIRFSVDWWNTLHQPASVLRRGGPSMPAEYLTPLLISALGCVCVLAAACLCLMRAEIFDHRARRVMMSRLRESDART